MKIKRGSICVYPFTGSGSVQKGRRPCVVVSNDCANLFSSVVTVLPITSKLKNSLPTHTNITLDAESTILAEQITTVERDRLELLNISASKEKMYDINRCLEVQLNLNSRNLLLENQRLKRELEYYKSLVYDNQSMKLK